MNTRTIRTKGNTSFRDDDYSPPRGSSMWEDCPKLAALQDPSIAHWYRNHFQTYAAGDWTLTTIELGGGSATEAVTDEAGGVLKVTNDAADNDSDEFQLTGESFQLVAGKPFWLEGRFKISEATQSDFIFGLCITDTILFDGLSDGVYFLKSDAATALTYHSEKDSTDTTANVGYTVADATYMRLGIKVPNGPESVEYWVDGQLRQSAATVATIPDDELLRPSFGIMNGEAVAKILSCDYLEAFQIL